MIYEPVTLEENLHQGDIFYNLPFIRIDLENLSILLDESEFKEVSWGNLDQDEIVSLAYIEKSHAIVLSQDCDCLRSPYITLVAISPWEKNYKTDKNWMNKIIQLNRHSPSKMYLPTNKDYNINVRMHVDFEKIFNISRKNLESLNNLRICRLNVESMEHFREKTAFYFHRYAYTEYYPLNKKEMNEYEKDQKKKDSKLEFERRNYQT